MRATGYACDVCRTFATSEKNDRPPNRWMSLTVYTSEHSSMDTFHICSNKCLKNIGTSRWRAEREDEEVPGPPQQNGLTPVVSSGRNYTPEARALFRQNGLKLQHGKGNHSETPNPECPTCQEELQMGEEELKALVEQK